MKIRLSYTKNLPDGFEEVLGKALGKNKATRMDVKQFLARYGTHGAAELMKAATKEVDLSQFSLRRGRGRPSKIEYVTVQ